MPKKKILEIFDRRPLIWFHYLLLVILVEIILFLTVLQIGPFGPGGVCVIKWGIIKIFIILYLVISIGDQLIHKILKVD